MSAATAFLAPRRRCSIALVGNPNCGKTALFNLLTGARQKVANYAGVTVEHKAGLARLADGGTVTVIDLPGAYSLTPATPDEAVTLEVIEGRRAGEAAPDAHRRRRRRDQPAHELAAGAGAEAPGPADDGRAQHGRRGARAGPRHRRAAAGRRTGLPGGRDRRGQPRRPRGAAALHRGRAGRPAARCSAGAAGRARAACPTSPRRPAAASRPRASTPPRSRRRPPPVAAELHREVRRILAAAAPGAARSTASTTASTPC